MVNRIAAAPLHLFLHLHLFPRLSEPDEDEDEEKDEEEVRRPSLIAIHQSQVTLHHRLRNDAPSH
jgi:hypothetical protein